MNSLSSSVEVMTFRLLAATPTHPHFHSISWRRGCSIHVPFRAVFDSLLFSVLWPACTNHHLLQTETSQGRVERTIVVGCLWKGTQKQAGPLFLRQVTRISVGETGIDRPPFSFSFYLWRSCSLTLISSAYIIVVMNILKGGRKGNGEIRRLRKSFQYYFMLCKPYLNS